MVAVFTLFTKKGKNYFIDILTGWVTGVLLVPQHVVSVPGNCRHPPVNLLATSAAFLNSPFTPPVMMDTGYCIKGNVSIKAVLARSDP